jgi:hypothetical protein
MSQIVLDTRRPTNPQTLELSRLKIENAELKKQIGGLEEKLSVVSKSLSDLTQELAQKQQISPVEPVSTVSGLDSTTSSLLGKDACIQFVQPGLLQAIEQAILRIVPGIIHSQLKHLSHATS